MTVKKYCVTISYQTSEICVPEVYAASEDQAAEIALVAWRGAHTDKCINPQVVQISEKRVKPRGEG